MMGLKEFFQIRFDFFRFYDPLFHYSLRGVDLRLGKLYEPEADIPSYHRN
jgi:hypothetical protein